MYITTTKLKITLLLVMILLVKFSIHSQDFENYIPLQCAGVVPNDFKSKATEKYLSDLKISNEKSNKDKEAKKIEQEFLLDSNFQINDILFSGRVLFGDPTSNYVNKVADVLLTSDLELRKKLRFYVIKSDVVNAFTTQQGIIFVNLGLLAQVNSEAELAFVLAHEIGHYVKGHVLEGFLEKEKVKKDKNKGSYRTMGIDQRIEELYKHSRASEGEADIFGFELYKKSKYSMSAIKPLFDVLLYSYLPFDEVTFTYDFIEDNFFRIPEYFKMDSSEIKEVSAKEDGDDSRSTHPNIYKRKLRIEELVANEEKEKNKVFYIVGESDFKLVQKLARFEVCHIYLTVGNYAKAFYSGWLLKKLYNENKYADKVMLMAVYGLSRNQRYLQSNYAASKVIYTENDESNSIWSNIEGSSQPVYHMLYKLSDQELLVLSAGMAWRYRTKYPRDSFILKVSEVSVKNMVLNYEFNTKSFYWDSYDVVDISNSETEVKETSKKKKKNKVDFCKNIFISLQQEAKSELQDVLKKYMEQKAKIEARQKRSKSKVQDKANSKEDNNKSKGIERMILINPDYAYYKLSQRMSSRYAKDYLKSEEGIVNSEKTIFESSKNIGIEVTMVDNKDQDQNLLENVNISNQMISWVTEKLRYEDSSEVLFENQYVNEIIYKTNTEYLGITLTQTFYNVSDFEKRTNHVITMLLASPINPIFFGWAAYKLKWGSKGFTEYAFVVFNIRTNKLEYLEYEEFYDRCNWAMNNQLLYNSLYRIKTRIK